MYSHIFFAIFIVGILLIFENLKGKQKITFLKLNILTLLVFITSSALCFFLDENGFNVRGLFTISRVFATISLVNIYYVIANNKIPKSVLFVEALLIIIFLIMYANGFSFLAVKNGGINAKVNGLQKFNLIVVNGLIVGSMILNTIKVYKSIDKNNLYQVKIKNWAFFLFVLLFVIIFFNLFFIFLLSNDLFKLKADTRMFYASVYIAIFCFVLFRPRFLDDADFSYTINKFPTQQSSINAQDFEFLFYSNHYYLQPEANIDDLALKLNHTKAEVSDFLKMQSIDSFTELLNRNRIKYFTDLLKSKKQDSFTIEALSEMSGFKSRKTMYNTFNKYHGMTPSEFINKL